MGAPATVVRTVQVEELDALARLWFDAWQDGHAAIAPAEVARHRTVASFRERLTEGGPALRAIGPVGDPDGFTWVIGDELYQLFVHARVRGTGAAAVLLADAEQTIGQETTLGWLACAIGNDRAARFYEKNGWRRSGVVTSWIDLPDGLFPLDVWRYEKQIGQD